MAVVEKEKEEKEEESGRGGSLPFIAIHCHGPHSYGVRVPASGEYSAPMASGWMYGSFFLSSS